MPFVAKGVSLFVYVRPVRIVLRWFAAFFACVLLANSLVILIKKLAPISIRLDFSVELPEFKRTKQSGENEQCDDAVAVDGFHSWCRLSVYGPRFTDGG